MSVRIDAQLWPSYFWKHPAWIAKEALEIAGVSRDWVVRYDGDRGRVICQTRDGGFEISGHVINDSNFAYQAIAHYVQKIEAG